MALHTDPEAPDVLVELRLVIERSPLADEFALSTIEVLAMDRGPTKLLEAAFPGGDRAAILSVLPDGAGV
jgi:hypothetical protein